ncbi:uncharacterized protein LOC126842301, partial [Adelges cooleyi]|uniref:uncharacterized protein LOC126842301 n=1 Tax=Adelges cooleyi TaxID=133065 RepID=UPI00217F4549
MEESIKIAKLCNIEGEYTKPVLTSKEADAQKRYKEDLLYWQRADSKCQKLIVTSVDNGPMQYLINCKTSYVKDSADDMSTHITKLQNLQNQLSLMGQPVTESMLMTKILMTLPSEYKHFYSAWDSMQLESKNLNELTSRLLIEESRMNQGSSVVES